MYRDSDEVIIPRSGGKGVVLMSLSEYNSFKETEYLMSSPAMMQAIREAQQEIANGDCITAQIRYDGSMVAALRMRYHYN